MKFISNIFHLVFQGQKIDFSINQVSAYYIHIINALILNDFIRLYPARCFQIGRSRTQASNSLAFAAILPYLFFPLIFLIQSAARSMIMRPMRIVRRSQAATIKTEYRFAIDLHARYMSTGRVLQVREPAPRTLADFFSGIGLLHHLQRIINDYVLTGALLVVSLHTHLAEHVIAVQIHTPGEASTIWDELILALGTLQK